MNAIRVSRSAGLRLGMTLTSMVLMAGCVRPADGSQVVITVTGTANGGRDMFHIFGNNIPADTPYTLVFRFDEARGQAIRGGPCSAEGSGIVGSGPHSPGTAVLTMNGRSYEFGHRPDARSRTWRSVASMCSESEIGIQVQEGQQPLMTGVNIKIRANPGQRPLTKDRDWRSSVSLSNFEARNGDNAFVIRRPGNYAAETMSYLSVDSLTVGDSARAGLTQGRTTMLVQKAVFETRRETIPVSDFNRQDERIYVLSADGGRQVTTYTFDGKRVDPTIALGWWYCTGLAVDEAGRIYVSKNWAKDQVTSYKPDGFPTEPVLNVGSVSGIAVGGSGKVHVLAEDAKGRAVIRTFTSDGKETVPTIRTGLSNANALAVESGKIYVAYQDGVKSYEANGEPGTPTIKAGLNSPVAIALGPHGRIYVANSFDVLTYLANGERTGPTIRRVNPVTGAIDRPMALATDSDGRLYVGYLSGTVIIYDADGKVISRFRALPGIWGIAVH